MDNINNKKILCFNIINNKKCLYQKKCMYAHSLSEQKIDPMRHKVYTIINNNTNLESLNLIDDNKLFNTLIKLTKVCMLCIKSKCPGGYNCRNGAMNYKYKLCYDDLMSGNCKRLNCNSVHLTKHGLVPYLKQKKDCMMEIIKMNKNNIEEQNNNLINKAKITIKDIPGVLITNNFLTNRFNYDDTLSESSSTDENIDGIIRYLNADSESESELEKLIFHK